MRATPKENVAAEKQAFHHQFQCDRTSFVCWKFVQAKEKYARMKNTHITLCSELYDLYDFGFLLVVEQKEPPFVSCLLFVRLDWITLMTMRLFFEKFLILTCYSFKQLCLELFCGDAWHFNSTFRFLRLSDQIIILNYDLKKLRQKSTNWQIWPTTLTIYSVWRILSEVRALQYIQTSFKEKSTKLIKPPTQQNSCPQTREWNQNWQFIIFLNYAI